VAEPATDARGNEVASGGGHIVVVNDEPATGRSIEAPLDRDLDSS
jgi:hypothetical protein